MSDDYSISSTISADDSDFQQTIKRVIGGLDDVGDSFAKMSTESKQSLAGIANEFTAIDAKAKVWGDSTNVLADKQRALKNEINKLIDSGIAPESKQIQDLKKSYDDLGNQSEKTGKKMSLSFADVRDVMQGPIAAIGLIKNALSSLGGATVGEAMKIEDMVAAFTPLVGGAKEASAMIGELNTLAAKTPFALEGIGKVSKQLLPIFGNDVKAVTDTFRMLGDTAGGNIDKLDSITRGYVKTLNTGKVSMEALNMISDAGVPIQTQLAKSMGISVEQLYKMSSQGKVTDDDLTKAFQNMTSEGGIFFKGMEVASTTLSGSLSTMSDGVGMAGAAIGNIFLPVVKDIANMIGGVAVAFADWAKENGNLEKTLGVLALIVASVTGAIIAFTIASSIGPIIAGLATGIGGLSTAFKALTGAIASNPIGAIAAVITAVLIPAIILLVKNWDTVVEAIKTTSVQVKLVFEILGSKIKEIFTVAFNSVKIAALSLSQIIIDKVLGAVEMLLTTMGKLPFVGEQFKVAAAAVGGFRDKIDESIVAAKTESVEAIKAGKAAQDAAESRAKIELNNIAVEKELRKNLIEEQVAGNETAVASAIAVVETKKELTAEEKKQAEELAKLKLDWQLKTTNDFLAKLQIERTASMSEAIAKGADAETIYNINKFYNDEITKYEKEQGDAREVERQKKIDGILAAGKSVVDAIGGDGAQIFSDLAATATSIGKAAASGFTDIGADIQAIAGLINLAGEANKEKFAEVQKVFAEIGVELMETLSPLLSVILDILLMILPVIEALMPLVELTMKLLQPVLDAFTIIADNTLDGLVWALEQVVDFLEWIADLIDPILDGFNDIGDKISDAAEKLGDFLKKGGNKFWDGIKGVGETISGWFGFASGTRNAPGGWARVGEAGPEMIRLPQGSQVFTNKETNNMMNRSIVQNIYAGESLSAAEIARRTRRAGELLLAGGVF